MLFRSDGEFLPARGAFECAGQPVETDRRIPRAQPRAAILLDRGLPGHRGGGIEVAPCHVENRELERGVGEPAFNSLRRNSTGSALAAAASSSMNDSDANVTCGPFGSRRLPVRSGVSHTSGRPTTCAVARRLGIEYISDGVAAPPRAGVARRVPIS